MNSLCVNVDCVMHKFFSSGLVATGPEVAEETEEEGGVEEEEEGEGEDETTRHKRQQRNWMLNWTLTTQRYTQQRATFK